ncbi:related to TAD3 Subunit of tRNA-specific adenosine-34 deaminase [Rhynchosporium agropyri]|uniref:Related to TAD3 Subunit of tRNA-specific adenosine-34 deaminase n=1 Tax=Rhynchosporium agropyri TaxID=914238 RepID=A0A1E1JW85_9HELO|nr:related to TAD3 Subunit of tRNA-specific adenosine-34 deaminase [Rhynchosporium agropyri]
MDGMEMEVGIETEMHILGEGGHDCDSKSCESAGVHIPVPEDVPVPRNGGRFVPLKTTLETRAVEKIGKVYVTGVPAKLASAVLTLVRKLVPDDGGVDFQHLRRFAKLKDLPPHISSLLSSSPTTTELFLIAGPVSAIPLTDLLPALASILGDVSVVEVDVPLLAPTSQDQATAWTGKYWPTVYKKSNPFGPHPSIVERAEEEMRGEVVEWMEVAERVASEAEKGRGGERVGVVVVERREGRGSVVAVAGDGRWSGWERGCGGGGNVVAHAVMRVIGMVAGGLKAREETSLDPSKQNHADLEASTKISEAESERNALNSIFTDTPSSLLETQHYDPSGNQNGYLCHDLEIYCTHEPCVMCSMAIVHSRFGRVVFKRRMNETGGLCADGELGHGLWWRKELNWTMLGWQWAGDDCEQEKWNLHA